ncbi:MAG: extracellular solute-binding protein [Clostridia bacterium]|nr:extracellular solute-binding protein [Clostridia bacterium]
MKKLVSLLLVAMMALSLVPAMAAEEPIEIIVGCKSFGNGWPKTLEEDFMYQKILEETGVSWKLVLIDDYWAKMGQRIAGNDIPDVFFIDADHQYDYVEEDVMLNLDPYIENELKPVFDFLADTNRAPYLVNGSLYSLPRMYSTGTGSGTKSQWGLFVRQDWLDALQLEVPTDINSLYAVAKAFSENDPDGNGVDDTYGISGGSGIRGFHVIGMCFDFAFENYFVERDGKITNSLLSPGAVDALTWAKKFVDEGLMDPDIMTTTGTNNAIAGKVGLHMISWPGMAKQYAKDNIAAVNPNAKWIVTGPLNNEIGDIDYMYPYDGVGGGDSYALCADLEDEPEKLAAVFKVLNYLASEEGSYLTMFGLEDYHWSMVDGKPVMNPDEAIKSQANYISTYQIFSRVEMPYLLSKFPEAEPEFQYTMSINQYQYLNSLVVPPEGMFLNDMNAYITNQLAAFVYGDREISQAEYDKFLGELDSLYGFNDYVKTATEQLNAYGYGVAK